MPVQRKVFRIEQMGPLATPSAAVAPAGRLSSQCDPTANSRAQLKSDTDAIQFALNRTKQEIIALHVERSECRPARVTRELDAVVESAERATQQILNAAEDIEEAAKTLSASLKHQQELSLALDIQDNVLRIFEACNFQDLSGQRIAKVLATLKFVEERVAHMVAIWGGNDALQRRCRETRRQTRSRRDAAWPQARRRSGSRLAGGRRRLVRGGLNAQPILLRMGEEAGFGWRNRARHPNASSASVATSASAAESETRSATRASTSGAMACIARQGPAIRPIRAP